MNYKQLMKFKKTTPNAHIFHLLLLLLLLSLSPTTIQVLIWGQEKGRKHPTTSLLSALCQDSHCKFECVNGRSVTLIFSSAMDKKCIQIFYSLCSR